MRRFKLSSLLLTAGALFALTSCGGTAATPNPTPPVVNRPEPLSSAPAKYTNPHFERGALTGHLHHLDIDTWYAIMDYLQARGAEPSPRNIDAVYDAMTR